MSFTIAPVKEASVVYEVLANIDLLFAGTYTAGSIQQLATLGAMIGLLVGCIRGILTQRLDIHLVVITMFVYSTLMIPRVSVEVRDGSTGGPLIGVVQIPLGIAAGASLFSTVSDGLTRLYSDYVTTPSGWSISPNETWKMVDGMRRVVAPQIMDSKVNTTVPHFANNIQEYIQRCVVDDLAGTTSGDAGGRLFAMLEGSDIFEAIESRWGWRLATWVKADGTEEHKTCPDYYSDLKALWVAGSSWTHFQQEAARLLVGNESLGAQTRLSTAHRSAVEDLLTGAEASLEFMKKLYLQNHLVAMAERSPGGITTVKMLADAKYDTLLRSTTEATLWSEVVWKYATLIWVLVIALLPALTFLMFLGASGLKLFFTFFAALAWVSLWNPIAAVLQSILAIAYTAAMRELYAGGGIEIGSIKAKMLYFNELSEWISTGNYLMMSVPVIALFMLTGSNIAANSLIRNMNSEKSIDTGQAAPRDGSWNYGPSAVFNQGDGRVGRSEVGANSVLNEKLNFGDTIASSSSQSITAARDAANDTRAAYTTAFGQVAEGAQAVARENSFTESEQSESGTSSADQRQAAFTNRQGGQVSTAARATAGVAMQLQASNSIKRMINTAVSQRAYNQFMKRDVQGKGAGLDALSDRQLNILSTASSMETANLQKWAQGEEANGRTPTADDYRRKTNELRDVGAVTGKGPEKDAERERRNMLSKHGNTTSHQLTTPEGKSLAGGRLKGGTGGAVGRLMTLAGVGYAIMPDIGVSGRAEAASTDEATRVIGISNELSETNLASYSTEDMQRATDRWQKVMKENTGFGLKDTEQVMNTAEKARSARETLGERVAVSTDGSSSTGNTTELTRQSFMNRSQDLSREGLRGIEGVGALMDTERGQRLLDRSTGGGLAEFAWQAVSMAAKTGDQEMAKNILKSTGGFDSQQIESALGGAGVARLGGTIGDGKLTADEFDSGSPNYGGADDLRERVESGSRGVRAEADKANNFGHVPKAPVAQGETTAVAKAAISVMPEHIERMKAYAQAGVEDRTSQRITDNQQRFNEQNLAVGNNWLEHANQLREANGLAPLSDETMSLLNGAKGAATNMIERFVNPRGASNTADQGAETLSMLEGAQGILAKMDPSKLTTEQRGQFDEYQKQVDTGIGAATASGALGGIALPEGNVNIGDIPAITNRVDAISSIGVQYGDKATAAFTGLVGLAHASGQGDAVTEPAGATGDYMNAGTVIANNANRMRINDAVHVEGAIASIISSAASAVGIDPQNALNATGTIMDAGEKVYNAGAAAVDFLSAPETINWNSREDVQGLLDRQAKE